MLTSPIEKDLLRSVDRLVSFLCKSYPKPLLEKRNGKDNKRIVLRLERQTRTEQGQHKDIVRSR